MHSAIAPCHSGRTTRCMRFAPAVALPYCFLRSQHLIHGNVVQNHSLRSCMLYNVARMIRRQVCSPEGRRRGRPDVGYPLLCEVASGASDEHSSGLFIRATLGEIVPQIISINLELCLIIKSIIVDINLKIVEPSFLSENKRKRIHQLTQYMRFKK